jgi:hypothetical protein
MFQQEFHHPGQLRKLVEIVIEPVQVVLEEF